jgi:hypothetical protein
MLAGCARAATACGKERHGQEGNQVSSAAIRLAGVIIDGTSIVLLRGQRGVEKPWSPSPMIGSKVAASSFADTSFGHSRRLI